MSIIICGPTASGKTELALELSRLTGGEIISADSRQIYKYLTIGTAKPQGEYKDGVYTVQGTPYHLVDFAEADAVYNTGLFCKDAARLEGDIKARGKTAVFAGGTGMYLQSYFGGMDTLPQADPALRDKFNTIYKEEGKERLHQMLAGVDPASAAAIPAGNVQRVMRALEIFALTATPASVLRTGKFKPSLGNNFTVYINLDKEVLNQRIAARTQNMFEGMVQEAAALLARGYTRQTPALKSLGYAEIIDYIEGALSKAAAVERITVLTRQYAKRQRTWFARYKDIFVAGSAELSAQNLAEQYAKYSYKAQQN